jgi:hypothetical protein
MCWQCAHPGSSHDDYLAHLRELLDQYCWVVQGVQRDRSRAGYAYTIGMAGHDAPELIVTGLPYQRAVDLLNDVAGRVLDGKVTLPAPGERVTLPGGRTVEVVRIAEPAVHLAFAAEFYGPRFRAVQLVYADDRGRWPWDVGFRGGRGGQPVLGARGSVSGRASGRRR